MALTRAQLETILVGNLGAWLAAADLAVTFAGTNADLAYPMASAIVDAGYDVADMSSPTDAELAIVPDSARRKVIDLAELRTLEAILQNYDGTDLTAGPVKIEDDDLGQRIERRIAAKRTSIYLLYGIGRAGVSAASTTSATNTQVW
jgi:hypothetical protein